MCRQGGRQQSAECGRPRPRLRRRGTRPAATGLPFDAALHSHGPGHPGHAQRDQIGDERGVPGRRRPRPTRLPAGPGSLRSGLPTACRRERPPHTPAATAGDEPPCAAAGPGHGAMRPQPRDHRRRPVAWSTSTVQRCTSAVQHCTLDIPPRRPSGPRRHGRYGECRPDHRQWRCRCIRLTQRRVVIG
jgi:hypothetical protein